MSTLLLFLCALATTRAQAAAQQVELVHAGAEPRARLVLQPQVGQTTRISTRSVAHTTAQVSLVPDPPPTRSTTSQTIEVTVDEVASDGGFTWSWRVVQHELVVEPPPERKGERKPAQVPGLSGRVHMSASGLPLSSSHSGGEAEALAARAISRLPTPLPAAEVGPGAVWTVSDRLELDALAIDTLTTWTLQSVDGDAATLSAVVTGRPDQTELVFEEATATVRQLDIRGTARVVQPLGAVVPTEREGSGAYAIDLRVRKGPLPIEIELDIQERNSATSDGSSGTGR